MKILKIFFLIIIFSFSKVVSTENHKDFYICTAANSAYFSRLINLIGSLHVTNYHRLHTIAVFDLGLSAQEKSKLNSIKRVKVFDLKTTHPDQLKFFYSAKEKRNFLGWYTWKPVILKQSLDMFPYVLWLDAATTILKPLDDVFDHIMHAGYLLITIGDELEDGRYPRSVGWGTTQAVIKRFNLETPENFWVLEKESIMAGVIGASRNHWSYEKFFLPLYESAKDFSIYEDDGSAEGYARFEQVIMSILAYTQNFTVFKQDRRQTVPIKLYGAKDDFYITWDMKFVDSRTHIFSSRDYMPNYAKFNKAIKYRKKN